MPPEILDRFGYDPVEATRRLEALVALLKDWQRAHNLVAPSTLDDVWTRHVVDSLQLLKHAPDFSEWVDLGSGAGFPGLVVAIACAAGGILGGGGVPSEGPGASAAPTSAARRHVTLVEANAKKAAFLRAAIRATGADASVVAERIEAHAPKMRGRADVVSARALAPLPKLLGLAAPYLHAGSTLLLLKGREYVEELKAAAQSYDFDVVDYASMTDSGGRVLAIRNLSPKAA